MSVEQEHTDKEDGFAEVVTLGKNDPLRLSSGETLSPFKIALSVKFFRAVSKKAERAFL